MSENFELLGKTEIHIQNVILDDVNLGQIAAVVADTLDLPVADVFVIDARDDLVTLDVMKTEIDAESLLGKKEILLKNLGNVKGLTVTGKTTITSHGILGWIVVDEDIGKPLLSRAKDMSAMVLENLNKRVMVIPTGPEVINAQIEDTNSPYITRLLSENGFKASIGEALPDNQETISSAMREAIHGRGYRYVITTGGVGAESKDCSVESLLELDQNAATPYIAKFDVGVGRHAKNGIRIGVGVCADSTIICLPGPHDEVVAVMPSIIERMMEGCNKHDIANTIVSILRKRWLGHHYEKGPKSVPS